MLVILVDNYFSVDSLIRELYFHLYGFGFAVKFYFLCVQNNTLLWLQSKVQLFLSLALHITNVKNSFIDDGHTRFELAGFMNTAYAFSAFNLVITIICNTKAVNEVSAMKALDSLNIKCVAQIINKCKSNQYFVFICSKLIILILYFIQCSNWILWFIITLYFPLLLVYERRIWQGALLWVVYILIFIIVKIIKTNMKENGRNNQVIQESAATVNKDPPQNPQDNDRNNQEIQELCFIKNNKYLDKDCGYFIYKLYCSVLICGNFSMLSQLILISIHPI